MRQTNVRGSLSLRGFRKLRTGAIVATGVILLGLGFLAPTVSASEQDGVWVARTVEEVKADLQKEGDLFKYVIKWGDTLSVISEASNIPVDVLQEMNQASGKNLFLPHNELYFTEAETVSDTVTKHKIVIKESGASGEVRTYEVLLKKDQETKAVTFELTDVTEKVEKMTVNYSPVYQPVSAPVASKAEEPATPAPKAEEPAAPGTTEQPTPAQPAEDQPAAPGTTETPAPAQPAEEAPATPGTTETPAPVKPAEDQPAAPGATETPAPAQPAEGTPAAPGTTEEVAKEAEGKESAEAGTSATTETATPAPAGEEGNVETSNNPSTGATTSTDSGGSTTVTDATPSNDETTEQSGSSAPKAEVSETPVVEGTTSENKEEQPAPKEVGTTAGDEGKEAEESGTEANTTPKEDTPEGTVDSAAGEEGKDSKAEGPETSELTEPEPAPSVSETANEDNTVAEGTTSSEAGNTDKTSVGETGKQDSATNAPSADSKEEAVTTPEATEKEVKAEESAEPGTSATVESVPPSTESVANGAEGTEANPAPKENVTEGTEVKEDEEKETGGTSEPTGETSGATTEDEQKEAKETEVEPASKETGEISEPTGEAPRETEEASTDEKAKKDLEDAQEEGRKTINDISTSKSVEIEKVKDETEKEKLKRQLEELKTEALEAIKNAKNHDAAVDATADYQTKIDEINVPGEELPAPNYDKDNLSTGRNDGTTIEGGSTAIGHGSGEAPSATTQPEAGTDNSATTPPQPATETSTTSTTSETSSTQPTAETTQVQPASTGEQPAGTTEPKAGESATSDTQPTAGAPATTTNESSAQPTNESSSSTGAQPVATSETEKSGTSSFRRAGEYRATARRVARSVNEPEGTINISYNYDGMPDIHGFFADPGENNTVTVTNSTTEDKVKELVKAKIQAKANELAKHGYKVKEEIVFEQDTDVKNFNYVVTFTKETTGTTGFRIAPKVQVRAKKVVKRDLSNKTKKLNVYYNLTALKDIAGALGELGGENVLTFSGETSKEELKRTVEEKTKAQIEKLKKQGFTVTSKTDLDQIIEGGDSYDYVVEFTKESKTQPVGTTGFRMAPAVQRRAKRSTEAKETVNVNIYFNLKTLPGIAGALDVDGETTIKLPKNASEEEVKEAIKAKIAKVENRGYKVTDAYFGAKTEKGYDYVVEFTK